MAFDSTTRSKLAKMVASARLLLSQEFTEQLQEIYGIQPDGTIIETEKLSHLNDEDLSIASMLRDRVEHLASNMAVEKKPVVSAIDRMTREQAFTLLNRFAALRMCEERSLIQESIGNGIQSKGFKVYLQIAGSGLGETYVRYRTYLLCLFDEIAVDLGIIFDRFSSFGLLFPREDALLQLLEIVNNKELIDLWAEDETIGWIYQYFNSQEERKKMRDESAAPRNSRELAVRNQFFTPRYVVEFLTDNTLGRIWYEMTQGETSLKDQCRYLVRRANEIFMAEGEETPEDSQNAENPSQEELLTQPVYIPFRKLKDPREIKMLDPACGSMHFGLYAYDLYERIYDEAWEIESQFGAFHFQRSEDLVTLHEQYETKENFLADVPRLIIEHNIHGIDIDPRAAQIAGLSLWLRAQRSWQRSKIKTSRRPKITKSNIICAEPMPGDKKMLVEFTENLQPRVLGQLVEIIFDKMQLAGEAGSLLKIEEEIEGAIEKARVAFNDELQKRRNEAGFLPGMAPQKKQTSIFDFADLPGKTQFWNNVESSILGALQQYSKQADSTVANRKSLFAQDTEKGLAFIDLCSKRYDTVLMNPPFGEASGESYEYLNSRYTDWNKNVLCAFIERSIDLENTLGSVGAIFDRTAVIKSTYEKFRRRHLVPDNRIRAVADLGWEILDANVEVIASVLSKVVGPGLFVDVRNTKSDQKDVEILKELNAAATGSAQSSATVESAYRFNKFPNAVIGYDFPVFLRHAFAKFQSLDEQGFSAYQGHALKSDKHFRVWWECQSGSSNVRARLFNGSGYSPYKTSQLSMLVAPVPVDKIPKDTSTVIRNPTKHLRKGVCFGKRGEFFTAHVLPPGFVFTVEGQSFPLAKRKDALALLGFLNTPLVRYSLNRFCGQHKYSGYVNLLPYLRFENEHEVTELVLETIKKYTVAESFDELSPIFTNTIFVGDSLTEIIARIKSHINYAIDSSRLTENVCSECIEKGYDLLANEKVLLNDFRARQPNPEFPIEDIAQIKDVGWFVAHSLISISLGEAFGRWDIRYSTGERQSSDFPDDPFSPLPVYPPGMLQNTKDRLAVPADLPKDYPLQISWSGILVDDNNHKEDIVSRVREAIEVSWRDRAEDIEGETCEILGIKTLRDYISRPTAFFNDHLKRYSKSHRQAPLYWPLSTKSGSYTLWIYYHRLTDQTLFTCVTDFVKPKIQEIEKDIKRLRSELEKQTSILNRQTLESLLDFDKEMKDFHDEVLRIANLPYKPNLNDGVLINAAPLSIFFNHRKLNNDLTDCWRKLEKGEYDWSQMAYNIWPERVIPKCHKDRSLAVAHNLENEFWEQIENGTDRQGNPKYKWIQKKLSKDDIQRIIREKTGK